MGFHPADATFYKTWTLFSGNGAEGYFSHLKRGIFGTYHHISRQHLDLYIAGFNFRYNATQYIRFLLISI